MGLFDKKTQTKEELDHELLLYKRHIQSEIGIAERELEAFKINKTAQFENFKKEKELEIAAEIQSRKTYNWEELDSVRHDRIDKEVAIKTELAKLEATKESLTKEIEYAKNIAKHIVEANAELMKGKDEEIKRLQETVKLLIEKQPQVIINNSKDK